MRNTIDRAARMAYAFVLMNVTAVAGLVHYVRHREVWR